MSPRWRDIALLVCGGGLWCHSAEAMPRNYSAGAAPRYETAVGVWVKTALLRAGFRDEPPAVVIELRPDSAGIPGAKLKEFTQFESDLAVHGELTTLRDRAASLRPPIPWMVLALYHRNLLGRSKLSAGARSEGWARARLNDTGMTIGQRFMALRAFGLEPGMVVADAGCGWGRLGLPLIEYLQPDRYFGLELDAFELRAFIQLELGLEHKALALTKRPVLLQSAMFRFDQMMGLAPRADVVVFSSVLKPTMPVELRRIALCRAAQVLKPGGAVVIFQDCDQENACIAESLEGQFSHLSPFDKGRIIAQEKMCVLQRTSTIHHLGLHRCATRFQGSKRFSRLHGKQSFGYIARLETPLRATRESRLLPGNGEDLSATRCNP